MRQGGLLKPDLSTYSRVVFGKYFIFFISSLIFFVASIPWQSIVCGPACESMLVASESFFYGIKDLGYASEKLGIDFRLPFVVIGIFSMPWILLSAYYGYRHAEKPLEVLDFKITKSKLWLYALISLLIFCFTFYGVLGLSGNESALFKNFVYRSKYHLLGVLLTGWWACSAFIFLRHVI